MTLITQTLNYLHNTSTRVKILLRVLNELQFRNRKVKRDKIFRVSEVRQMAIKYCKIQRYILNMLCT